ncbi:MAG: rod shape-determining protein MreD [Bacteroidales bacterium]|nr:rod shape-determining protein MreD [Bacteroidales bacterium]
MGNTWLKLILLFVLLFFLQVWLFNKIHLFGYATPLLYIYLILKLPVDMNRNVVVVIAALTGLLIDVFSYTLGMHMLATVVAGFMRYYLLKIFTPRDMFESVLPSFSSFGYSLFLRYAGFVVLIHHILLFSIESLSLFDPVNLILRIVGSFILTMFLIFAFESINLGSFKK